jgi:hypothetical protein
MQNYLPDIIFISDLAFRNLPHREDLKNIRLLLDDLKPSIQNKFIR